MAFAHSSDEIADNHDHTEHTSNAVRLAHPKTYSRFVSKSFASLAKMASNTNSDAVAVPGQHQGQVGEARAGHDAAAVQSASDAGQVSPGMGHCYFDCGPPRAIADMTRTSAGGAWMCKPCNMARKALESVMRSDPEATKAMDTMKKTIQRLGRHMLASFGSKMASTSQGSVTT